MEKKPLVAIIAGSPSDRELLEEAAAMCRELGLETVEAFISAHRQPDRLAAFLREHDEEVTCYIAVAGLAAHLPGVIASKTIKPVIGVPAGGLAGGLDALLSIVQMPRGIPVATVAVKGATNAAILAAQIAALTNPDVRAALEAYRAKLAE